MLEEHGVVLVDEAVLGTNCGETEICEACRIGADGLSTVFLFLRDSCVGGAN